MRSRVRFKRQFKGRELLAHAYLLYLAVAVVSGGLPLGVLRLYALIPKVPAPDVAWSYLGCAVVGVASALAFVPKTYEAVERSDE